MTAKPDWRQSVQIPADAVVLNADLAIPREPRGVVLFAHGSGSGRRSPRNRFVAGCLFEAGLVTLLLDLLTDAESRIDERTTDFRFDVDLLGRRLVQTTDWLVAAPAVRDLPVGYFGGSTGAAAALVAASRVDQIRAVVSRGGRPDLAGAALRHVKAPTLLIVGGLDSEVMVLNEQARDQMSAPVTLSIVPGASHLFDEPGTLNQVADLARQWFVDHLVGSPVRPAT